MKKIFCIASMLILGTMLPIMNASATSIDFIIGDNDGFGNGVADNALGSNSFLGDERGAAEIGATNGAQQTDFYSANFTPLAQDFDITFALTDDLISAVFELDTLGLESDSFGELNLFFNGVFKTNALYFEDGIFNTAIHTIALNALDLANANTAGQFVATIRRGISLDAVAYDYFRLTGETTGEGNPSAVPVPAAAWLFGSALLGFLGLRRKDTV